MEQCRALVAPRHSAIQKYISFWRKCRGSRRARNKVAPFLLASSVKIIACCIFYFGHRTIIEEACDKLTEEVAKGAAEAGKEPEKTDGAKKAD